MITTFDAENLMQDLLTPERVWSRSEVLANKSPLPMLPGVYAWYFRQLPPSVPPDHCAVHQGLTLLYVGISPAKRRDDLPRSRQSLGRRVRDHYRGTADGSTLRLTLGCLLSDQLGIKLQAVGASKRMTFGTGESVLSDWMQENALVTWVVCNRPWELEEIAISKICLPLNLDQNSTNGFHGKLTAIRRMAKVKANDLAVMTR